MSKKYTLMFFSADRLGKINTFTVSKKFIIFACIVFLAVVGTLGLSLYKVSTLYEEKKSLLSTYEENKSLKNQMTALTTQLEEISAKISEIDNLEYKIRDLVTLQKGITPLKPIAVGGREIDMLRRYASTASLNEKDFFESLDSTLQELSFEVTQREINLSELASALEEKRMVMSYTPTIMPVNGWVSSTFGYRLSPFTNRQTFHEGIDIAARAGTDVYASGSGVVIFSGIKPGFGRMVIIDHGYGYITKYGHNSEITVKVGDKVSKGNVIAKVGSSGLSTGPHLHYEVHVNGIPVNPLKFIIEEKTN